MEHIFTELQREKSSFIRNNEYSKLSSLSSSEIKELAICWCYYSSKIEGNTYTFVETEALLKDGITSEKRYEDAKMLKNLYNTFIGELYYINKEKNKEVVDERTLYRIHKSLTSELVDTEESGALRTRAVRITGTEYVPPKESADIRMQLNTILNDQSLFSDPLERAVYLHCKLARLQPFIDGNKRTSRTMESIAMMNAGIIPNYSTSDSDILRYRKGLIEFYETGNYSGYADYFLDKQISRINSLSLSSEETFNLDTNSIDGGFKFKR